jgi:hypothetical protein
MRPAAGAEARNEGPPQGVEKAQTPSNGLARGNPRTSGRDTRRCRTAAGDSHSTAPATAKLQDKGALPSGRTLVRCLARGFQPPFRLRALRPFGEPQRGAISKSGRHRRPVPRETMRLREQDFAAFGSVGQDALAMAPTREFGRTRDPSNTKRRLRATPAGRGSGRRCPTQLSRIKVEWVRAGRDRNARCALTSSLPPPSERNRTTRVETSWCVACTID